MKTTLEEVCLPVATVHPEMTPNAEFTYFDIGGIDGESNRIVGTKTVIGRRAPSRARQAVQINDILFSTVRTYLKKIARIEHEYPNSIASTGFAVLRPGPCILPEFLFLQVLTDEFLQPLHVLQAGSSYPAVREVDIFAQSVLLPPLREQRRILARVSASLVRISAGEVAARLARKRLLQYRDAVVYAATTGRLTQDWRSDYKADETGTQLLKRILTRRQDIWEKSELERMRKIDRLPKGSRWKDRYKPPEEVVVDELPKLPKSWKWASLEMIAEIGSGISVSQNRFVEKPVEVPYLRVANVLRGSFDLSEMKKIRVSRDQIDTFLLKRGDILFTEGGDIDKLGRGWVWEEQIPECVHQNHVFRARLVDNSLINAQLISHWGNTFGQKFFIQKGVQSINLASINRSVLARLPVPIVPILEQAEISRILELRLSAAAQLADTINRQLDGAYRTRQSLLRKAFAGNLVSQNLKDEHASIQLEHTRVIRESLAKKLKNEKSKRNRLPKLKVAKSLADLVQILDALGGSSAPESLLLSAGLGDDIETFFDLLREGRKGGSLTVPTGEDGTITRRNSAN